MPYGKVLIAVVTLTVAGVAAYLLFKPEEGGNFFGSSKARRDLNLDLGTDLTNLQFPDEYHATGILSLPTSEVNEPFEIWYSKPADKSRIDYYGGKSIILILSTQFSVKYIVFNFDTAICFMVPAAKSPTI